MTPNLMHLREFALFMIAGAAALIGMGCANFAERMVTRLAGSVFMTCGVLYITFATIQFFFGA